MGLFERKSVEGCARRPAALVARAREVGEGALERPRSQEIVELGGFSDTARLRTCRGAKDAESCGWQPPLGRSAAGAGRPQHALELIDLLADKSG